MALFGTSAEWEQHRASISSNFFQRSVLTGESQRIRSSISKINADLIITGCTELSYAFSKIDFQVKWVNPLVVAAEVLHDLWQGNRSTNSLGRPE